MRFEKATIPLLSVGRLVDIVVDVGLPALVVAHSSVAYTGKPHIGFGDQDKTLLSSVLVNRAVSVCAAKPALFSVTTFPAASIWLAPGTFGLQAVLPAHGFGGVADLEMSIIPVPETRMTGMPIFGILGVVILAMASPRRRLARRD
jgi:hypothetical protein